MRSLCEAYQLGISIRTKLTHSDLLTAVEQADHSIDAINDGYPAWHPAPLSFRAMVLAFVIMEITGESYAAFTRRLTRHPELATALGFNRVPDESAFSRAWRNRFDNTAREYIETAAHFVVKEVHDDDIHAPEVRPKSEVIETDEPEKETSSGFSTSRRRPAMESPSSRRISQSGRGKREAYQPETNIALSARLVVETTT